MRYSKPDATRRATRRSIVRRPISPTGQLQFGCGKPRSKLIVGPRVTALPLSRYRPAAVIHNLEPFVALSAVIENVVLDLCLKLTSAGGFHRLQYTISASAQLGGKRVGVNQHSIGARSEIAPQHELEQGSSKLWIESLGIPENWVDSSLVQENRSKAPIGLSEHGSDNIITGRLLIRCRVERLDVVALPHQPEAQCG